MLVSTPTFCSVLMGAGHDNIHFTSQGAAKCSDCGFVWRTDKDYLDSMECTAWGPEFDSERSQAMRKALNERYATI